MKTVRVVVKDAKGYARAYDSITSAAIALNLSVSTIRKYIGSEDVLPGYESQKLRVLRI
ncbi:MAG: hypothetical protein WCR70_06425 [Sphaerochaetaceae bacterium]|jgi:hypothetical protein